MGCVSTPLCVIFQIWISPGWTISVEGSTKFWRLKLLLPAFVNGTSSPSLALIRPKSSKTSPISSWMALGCIPTVFSSPATVLNWMELSEILEMPHSGQVPGKVFP
ncbi:MAG: hypothetical protein A4E73_01770 [Syntrophaceae bacterium PtaU1.Bin231]|nr:MAG: hypothetical protein A4E73_01770 [Syntrophaceae bacterium PtaU1.Bin231]